MIAHLLIFNIVLFFTCSINDNAFLSLSWVEKQEFRLVYMYGKEIREGNRKEKEIKEENKRERKNKSGKREEREIREGNEMEKGKLSDFSPFNNI